jgi:hypothetical protein
MLLQRSIPIPQAVHLVGWWEVFFSKKRGGGRRRKD